MNTRPLTGINVLVIEEEFLIALDIGFIIEEAGGTITSVRSYEEARKLQADWPSYRLAVVNPPDESISESEIARDMQSAGIRLVICSANVTFDHLKSGIGAMPVVAKPFTADELMAACAIAMEL